MLVRNKEGKFFEIDEELLKGKEVEGPKPPKGAGGIVRQIEQSLRQKVADMGNRLAKS